MLAEKMAGDSVEVSVSLRVEMMAVKKVLLLVEP